MVFFIAGFETTNVPVAAILLEGILKYLSLLLSCRLIWPAVAMQVVNANWRGIGIIPASGFALAPRFERYNARKQFTGFEKEGRKRVGEMPPGCDCARVVLGKKYPDQSKLSGTACTPRTPVGPCMVSDEGACRIWRADGVKARSTA